MPLNCFPAHVTLSRDAYSTLACATSPDQGNPHRVFQFFLFDNQLLLPDGTALGVWIAGVRHVAKRVPWVGGLGDERHIIGIAAVYMEQ